MAYSFHSEQRRKYRHFHQGYSTFKPKLLPTHTDLLRVTTSYPNESDNRDYYEPRQNTINDLQVTLAGDRENREMLRTLELLQHGGTGSLSEKKSHGWIRLMFENWNSLGIGTQSWKLDRLNYLIKHLRIDIVAGCESQCNWTMIDKHNQLQALLTPGMATKGVTAHNRMEKIQKDQAGGTAIVGIGRVCDNISSTGVDHTGLGRWAWLRLGHGNTTTRILSAYLPHKPGRNSRGRTVWKQHSRYFEARGDLRYPSTIFTEDLLDLIRKWITQGEHVLLAIDANQNVYSGKLAQRLRDPPFNMTCMLEEATGEQVPNSHFSGSRQISTIFGSRGIVTGQGVCFPHWFGIGDHRVMVLEFSAKADRQIDNEETVSSAKKATKKPAPKRQATSASFNITKPSLFKTIKSPFPKIQPESTTAKKPIHKIKMSV